MPETRTVEVDIHPAPPETRQAWRILAHATPVNPDRPHEHAYLRASVEPVHTHDCPATSMSHKKHGPCTCGAHQLFDAWLGNSR